MRLHKDLPNPMPSWMQFQLSFYQLSWDLSQAHGIHERKRESDSKSKPFLAAVDDSLSVHSGLCTCCICVVSLLKTNTG